MFDGLPREEGVGLEDHAAIGAGAGDGLAVNSDVAGGGGFETGENACEGGFAAAGGADDAHELAFVDGEGDVGKGGDGAAGGFEGFGEAGDFEGDGALAEALETGGDFGALVEVGRKLEGGGHERGKVGSGGGACAVAEFGELAEGPEEEAEEGLGDGVATTGPGEDDAVEPGEDLIGDETGDADEDDDGEDAIEVAEAALGFDELGEAAFDADEFGDDEPGPGPAEEDAEVVVEIGEDAGDDDAGEHLSGAGAEGLGGFEEGGIEEAGGLGDDEDHLEDCADENERDFGCIASEQHGDEQGAEGGGGHVAEEIDEGFEELGEEVEHAAEDADGDADDAGPEEAEEDDAEGVLVALGHAELALGRGGFEIAPTGAPDFVGSGEVNGVSGEALGDEFEEGCLGQGGEREVGGEGGKLGPVLFDDVEVLRGECGIGGHFGAGGDVAPEVVDDGVVLRLGVGEPVVGDGDGGELAEEFLIGAFGGFGRGSGGEEAGIFGAGGDDHFLVVAGADVIAGGEDGAVAFAFGGELEFDVGMPDPVDVGDETPEGEGKDERDGGEEEAARRGEVAADEEPAFEE